MIYLDNAATSLPKPPTVVRAVAEALNGLGNGSRGGYEAALNADRLLYRCRRKLADLFGVPGGPQQVVFTGGATHSLNLAICGLFRPGDHVITTALEHNSVLRPLYRLQQQGLELTILPVDEKGRLDPDACRDAFRPNTAGVVCTHASNLCGNLLPVAQLGRLAHAHGALLVVDAAQTAGTLPLSMEDLNVDVLCAGAHKGLLGPQGLGILALRPGVQPRPLLVGGTGVQSFLSQMPAQLPESLEAGTLNIHAVAGLDAALDYLSHRGVAALCAREQAHAMHLYNALQDLPSITFYGDYSNFANRAPLVALNLGNIDSALLADRLARDYGICTRPGAHCAPLAHEAFGTRRQGAVRFSFGPFNTEADVAQACAALHALAAQP